MYAVLEHNPAARSDCTILSLSWKGTVPESEKEKSYTRKRCYTEGWLATGNLKGIVGATFSISHSHKSSSPPTRTNFNLRGHNSEVILVRWNEPFQKMATCDAQGVIFVWIKYEGRWSIELVNDRSCQVSDFAWSHDGRMALICYKDGFVLVGSVTGQRYWSSMLNLEAKLLCGAWAPDDKQVLLGTSDGQIIVMDIHGAVVTQCTLAEDRPIRSLLWSSEKFRMVNVSDNESDEKPDKKKRKGSERKNRASKKRPPIMAVDLGDGEIQLMKAYDDLTPISIKTGMTVDIKMEWSSCGGFLAVGGTQPVESISAVKFYNINGHLRFTLNIPSQRPLSALTWGHNDQRLFVACGSILHVAWVEKGVAPLQVLCREIIVGLVSDEKNVNKLPLPGRLKTYVTERSSVTVKGCIPDPSKLREFVSRPPPGNERLHCTMIRTGDESSASSPCYTLFLEYLGGLVPLLKGRRVSKLRPEFVIYDPKVSGEQLKSADEDERIAPLPVTCSTSSSSGSEDSDEETSTKVQRRLELSSSPRNRDSVTDSPRRKEKEYDNLFLESLPEQNRLLEVTSNIWGTKFKIHGLAPFLPTNLGQVNYRTSLLHLQPRQMTIALVELRPGAKPRRDEDPDFDPNVFSEDEDEPADVSTPVPKRANPIPIAPIPTTNRSFSSQDLNYIDQEPPLITTIPATNPSVTRTKAELASQSGVSIPTRQDCDKDQYIKQGAIPKRRASNRCKAALEAGNAVVGRTGALDVVDNAQIMNGSTEIVDGTIIDSESCELQADLPRWADSATKLLQSIPSAHTSEVAVNGHESLSPVEVPELGIELAELKKEVLPTGRTTDTSSSSGGEAGVARKSSITKNKPGKSKSYSPHRTNRANSTERTSSRDESPCGNGEKSPKAKPRRTKSKSRRNSHSAGPVPKSSNHHSESENATSEHEKSKKPKRRSSSCSSSPSRGCKEKPRTDTSDSEAEGNASEDESPAGTAKTRKAKLMRQYADCNSKVFVMHNKAPLWNENTQVYQLDFGGRVTQESAKNFQVELHQKQVMQFGRIDGHAYTLDFQYPFSALQAFSVALANVTQRLK